MSRQQTPEGSNTLRVGLLGEWSGLDPWEAQDLAGVIVRHQCFEGLYTRVDGKLEADRRFLATPLRLDTVSLDGIPRYSLRLADDLRFSDGSPVEPEDVVDSLMHVAPLRAVANINVAANRRVQFQMLDREAALEPHLAQIWSVIGKRGAEHWVGTGPYAIVHEAVSDSGLVLALEPNPHWIAGRQTRPTIERIEFHTYPLDEDGRPSLLRDAVETGAVDFTLMLPREVAKGLQGVRKVYLPGQSTALLVFDCRRRWMREVEVRRALAAAVDPWAIARVCHDNAAAFAARGLLPPALAPSQRSLPNYGHEVAVEALAQIADKPTTLRMLTVWGPRPYIPDPKGVADLIAAQFAALGISVTIDRAAGPKEFYEAIRRGEHDSDLVGLHRRDARPDRVHDRAAVVQANPPARDADGEHHQPRRLRR